MYHHDPHIRLSMLVESVARAARALLVLDECQPEEVRMAAIAMPADRLFWTLTQLDDGLDLDTCQALVRASRLNESQACSDPRDLAGQVVVAEAAARRTMTWLRRRLMTMADLAVLIDWLSQPDLDAAPPARDWSGVTPAALAPAQTSPPRGGALEDPPLVVPITWLDAPPVVGPPPGAPAGGLAGWPLVGRLRRAVAVLTGRDQGG